MGEQLGAEVWKPHSQLPTSWPPTLSSSLSSDPPLPVVWPFQSWPSVRIGLSLASFQAPLLLSPLSLAFPASPLSSCLADTVCTPAHRFPRWGGWCACAPGLLLPDHYTDCAPHQNALPNALLHFLGSG